MNHYESYYQADPIKYEDMKKAFIYEYEEGDDDKNKFNELNEIYTTKLNEVIQTKMVFLKSKPTEVDQISELLIESTTKLQLYASEAYICYGTVLHIVANNAKEANIKIPDDMYLDSFIENISFAIRECVELNEKKLIYPYLTINQTSKYVARALEAYFLYYMKIPHETYIYLPIVTFFDQLFDIRTKNISEQSAKEKFIKKMDDIKNNTMDKKNKEKYIKSIADTLNFQDWNFFGMEEWNFLNKEDKDLLNFYIEKLINMVNYIIKKKYKKNRIHVLTI